MSQSTQPDFWNSRYKASNTPWDFGGIPGNLRAFLKRTPKGRPKVLIPGCGTGHEIKPFADAGYDVTAIDFSPEAVQRARENAGPALAGRILLGDFFTHDFGTTIFDVIYERTFLCSLPPERRPFYRDRVATLLRRGGDFIGYFYYKDPDLAAGPPFGFAWGTSDELFGRHFLLTKDVPVSDSLPLFAGRERWQEQKRTGFNG